MGNVRIVIGSLLVLFGGAFVLLMAAFDPTALFGHRDVASDIFVVSLFGLLPLAAGVILIRKGVAKRRESPRRD